MNSANSGPDVKYKKFKEIVRNIDPVLIKMKRSKNPYSYVNGKTQKIEILTGIPYLGTSKSAVFEIRNQIADKNAL